MKPLILDRARRRDLAEALAAYGVFCGLGAVSRFIPVVFVLFVVYGIAFPLAWAALTKNWRAIGFSRRNLASALTWGLGAGLIWSLYTYVFFRQDRPLPPLWGLQIAIAIPVWSLVMSPFQEFFFRGWLQTRLQAVFGKGRGLGITALASQKELSQAVVRHNACRRCTAASNGSTRF